MTQTVAVLGTGKIGEALLSGMIRAGWRPADLLVTTRRGDRARELHTRYGVESVTNAEAAKNADVLILAVKPQDMGKLWTSWPRTSPPTAWSSAPRPASPPRSSRTGSPRTPRSSGSCPTPRSSWTRACPSSRPSSHATGAHLATAEEIFGGVGKTLRVPESQQDAATALSGSGPAYFYFLVEAMTDAGILLGLPRAQAHDLIVEAAIGAAVMLRDSGEHPVKLREAVTSPALHHHQRHPRAGEPRSARGPHRRPGGGPRPQPRTGLRQRLTPSSAPPSAPGHRHHRPGVDTLRTHP